MSTSDLRTGFYGKIPSTGDFVSRNLPAEFVRVWDSWVSRHVAPFQHLRAWENGIAFRFLIGPSMYGPACGILLPSADKAGRQFPLSIVVPLPCAATSMALQAESWFGAVIDVVAAARRDLASADRLADVLSDVVFPLPEEAAGLVDGMVLWTDPVDLVDVDPESPRAAFEDLLAAHQEVS